MVERVALLIGHGHGLSVVTSNDGGGTWGSPQSVLQNVEVAALGADAAGCTYAGTRGQGLFMADDDPTEWQQVDTPPEAIKIRSLGVAEDGLLVGTEEGPAPVAVLERNVAGAWRRIGALETCEGAPQWRYPVSTVGVHVRGVAADPHRSGRYYAAMQVGGVAIAEDDGARWHDRRNLNLDTHMVTPHPTRPGVLFAGTGGGGMYRSDDFGETWTPISEGFARFVVEFALDPRDPDRIYVGTARGRVPDWGQPPGAFGEMVRTTDGGASWEVLTAGLPHPMQSRVNAVHVDPAAPDHVFFAADLPSEMPFARAADAGVYFSPDRGDHWERIAPITDAVALWSVHR